MNKQRQALQRFERRRHQKQNAKEMRKRGGYLTFEWRLFTGRIATKLNKRKQLIKARKEAKLANTQI